MNDLLLGPVVCGFHLLLGLVIGVFVGRGLMVRSMGRRLAAGMKEHLSVADGLAGKLDRLAQTCSTAEEQADTDAIVAEVAALQTTARKLSDRIRTDFNQQYQKYDRSPLAPTPEPVVAKENKPEVPSEAKATEESPKAPSKSADPKDQRRTRRHRYSFDQYVAYCQDGTLPAAQRFTKVRCRDLSQGGVSYFCRQAPALGAELVITVGQGAQRVFVLGEVAYVRPASMSGASETIVGCRFLKRLTNRYRWNTNRECVETDPNPAPRTLEHELAEADPGVTAA